MYLAVAYMCFCKWRNISTSSYFQNWETKWRVGVPGVFFGWASLCRTSRWGLTLLDNVVCLMGASRSGVSTGEKMPYSMAKKDFDSMLKTFQKVLPSFWESPLERSCRHPS